MVEFFNIAIPGVFTGCVLALLGVGYSLIFNTTGIVNVAQGGFIVLGGLLSYTLHSSFKIWEPFAILISVAVITLSGALMERLIIRNVHGRLSESNILMVVAGCLLVFVGVATVGWGVTPVAAAPFLTRSDFSIASVVIPTQGILIAALTVVLLAITWLVLERSITGKALRASAQSSLAARLVGIPVERMGLFSFAASALLGSLAGAFFLPFTSFASTSIVDYSLLGLVVVAIGGLGSLLGAAVGGLILGIADAIVIGYVSTAYGDALSKAALILVLAFHPEGILGRGRGRRSDAGPRELGVVPVTPVLASKRSRQVIALFAMLIVGVLPLTDLLTSYLSTFGIAGILALAAIGIDLVSGTAGGINLGQGAFMAVGGYTASYLMLRESVSPLLGLLAGVAAAAVVAVALALVIHKVRGIYLAVVTLAFVIMVEAIINGADGLGASGGLVGISSFSIGGFSFNTPMRFYYLIWALVVGAAIVVVRINNTLWGRLTKLLHGSDMAASVLGYGVPEGRLVALVGSAVLGAISGALYAMDLHYISPSMVGLSVSLLLITMVFVGGAGTVIGPILGVLLFTFLPDVSNQLTNWFDVLEGGLLILVLTLLPSGLYGGFVGATRWFLARLSGALVGAHPAGGLGKQPLARAEYAEGVRE